MQATGQPQGAPAPLGEQALAARARRARVVRRPVHGVLLLDKPLGWSSNDALQKVKWLLRAEKAGHTGTLDPLASGVLPLCFGAATKFSQLQLGADKAYEATALLGIRTSTGDAEGTVLERRAVQVGPEDLERIRPQFVGAIDQLPPMYSALKKDGKALYTYARAGVEVERSARRVTIHALNLALALVDQDSLAIDMVVECSKGTYIRTLGEDIGQALGCGAHLTRLRRTGTGPFQVAQCLSLEALEAMTEARRLACLLPVQTLLAQHVRIHLSQADATRFGQGLRRRGPWADAAQVAVYAEDTQALLGCGRVHQGELIPTRVLSSAEITEIAQQHASAQEQQAAQSPYLTEKSS